MLWVIFVGGMIVSPYIVFTEEQKQAANAVDLECFLVCRGEQLLPSGREKRLGGNHSNCQTTIFGGFAPNSQTSEVLSKAMGSRTVLSGQVTRGKDSNSQNLQMMERALMTPDELKSLPKGQFVVMKTGTHPMQTRLRLYEEWGITFAEPYAVPDHGRRLVSYADRKMLEQRIAACFPAPKQSSKQAALRV